jgi:branched-chain amino acid transport system substrate-binding protein
MQVTKLRSSWLVFLVVLTGVFGGQIPAIGQVPKSIRIGYAISLTGPNALGASITQLPNYRMWINEVNAAGGIMLKKIGKRIRIEAIEYDDHSNADGAIRATERLINEDKVDFILPPWGTGLNLAVAPLFNQAGYPHLLVTAVASKASELAKQWPNSFWLLGTGDEDAQALVELLTSLRAEGKIGDKIAMVNVADEFGIDLSRSARGSLKRAKFDLVYDRPYPVGMTDMRPILTEVMKSSPDVFVAFSYPPDTMLLTEQSRTLNFNPHVFYTAVGTAYPLYRERFGRDVEGVMGLGGWNGDAPESRNYLQRHIEKTGQEPDRWASPVTYAGLQMLQQAIERVGAIDRAAVIKVLQTETFQTVLGPVKLEGNLRKGTWGVGQWQDGEFYGLAPTTLPGARQARVPKALWHQQ